MDKKQRVMRKRVQHEAQTHMRSVRAKFMKSFSCSEKVVKQ